MTDEKWIQFNEGFYEISNKGRLRNIQTNKLLKSQVVNNKLVFGINFIKVGGLVATYVAQYFLNNGLKLKNKDKILYKDGNSLNVDVTNLEIIFYDKLDKIKLCNTCNKILSVSEFNKKHDNKFGVRNICRSCEKEKRDINKNDINVVIIRRNYDKKFKLSKKNDPLYKLKNSLRRRIYEICIQKKIGKKCRNTEDILGISFNEYVVYIENQFDSNMSWDNYGTYWHIDHIIPLNSAINMEDMYKLNHYTNLRPLEATENIKKGSKILKM